jgi:hypothetical protein
LSAFDAVERTVLALAASGSRECGQITGNAISRAYRWILGRLMEDANVKPLANERLEALRLLACASLATGGKPNPGRIEAALAAGVTREQVDAVCALAA